MFSLGKPSWVACLLVLLGPISSSTDGATEDSIPKSVEKVAVLIRPEAWTELESDVSQYLADVTKHQAVSFETVVKDFQTPEQVRETLKSLSIEKAIQGVILVGAIPMHRFFIHDNASPNPLYYEDFELVYHDQDGDGVDDRATGVPDLKIWVANIRSTEVSDSDDCEGLRRYFAKVHQFRAGELDFEYRSVIVTDAELGLRSDEASLGRELFGAEGVELLATPKNTLSEFRNAFAARTYAICTMGVHSDWSAQELVGGDLTALEIRGMKTGAILTLNHGCYSANWCASERDGTGLSTAQSWVFGDGQGITAVANVRSGCIYGYEFLCDSLRQGNSIGAAYLKAKRYGEQEMREDYPDGTIISGVLLLGDPFLKFPFKR
ncbi:MAG: hypothetical protein MUC43_05765 [Pirellula sp.]|jgi:hypothetical protein|nr:hypothetical protein [Pirellula sp.]